jgi:cytochrome c biogenesis protein CcmG/thiol:disulfide interchange protein DsbE
LVVIGVFVLFISFLLGAFFVAMARRGDVGSFAGFGVNTVSREADVKVRTAPDISLVSLDGQPVRIADLKGRSVVVNFWASWCPPCQEEARALEDAWRSVQGSDVVFVGVNIWDADQDARTFLSRYGVTYTNALDASGRMAIEYGVTGIPETFGINANGELVRHWIGPMSVPDLQRFAEGLRA